MQRMKGWLSSKRLLIAQCEKAQRQLQEAWDSYDFLKRINTTWQNECDDRKEEILLLEESLSYTTHQLHRVARERDEERRLRLEAEKKHRDIVWAWSDKQITEAAEELRDTYLENKKE